MRRIHFFIKNGNLTPVAHRVFSILGLLAALGTAFYLDDLTDWRLWLLSMVAIVFGYGSAWAGLMKKWGFAPFTNDPLGWRKAKKSYQGDEASKESTTEKPVDK